MYSETFPADYSRLEQTPFTRSRLRQLSCVVVGAGALGNEVARVLGLLGSLRVTVVDPDVVEASNLPRSIFFCSRDTAGQDKAAALVAAAGRMFPETQWTAIGTEIADVGFQKLADANLLFSCVDSDLARLEMAYISARLHVPMVDGGLGRQNYSHGRVTYFPATANQACYGCMLSPTKRRELLELWQSTLRPCAPESDAGDSELVSTPTMAGIIGCIQVEFGLRSFYEGGEPASARSLELQIHPARRMEDFAVPVSVDCPFHSFEETLRGLPNANSTLEDLLDSAESDLLVLDWPICVKAQCLSCGKEWAPMLRLAALRRGGHCPVCDASNFIELETLRAIGRDSVWVGQTASALQLPVNHLYSVKSRAVTV